ncbi:MAG: hypothetical protein F6K48_17050 [Okeania sp. SIO3H1]|uniref:hypothetical protein n=1 Tax=Okeania sp. SIO1I7 TaxID=2607772 RepID=UPI0013C96748|nr:hypothetical protein [Okeania sp. SIO1I7]NEN90517.1 hypothetical protein [Okeania sp. SIO3H1]NET30112.1 hypothetical protein [Okeania sp. SIO1I7]
MVAGKIANLPAWLMTLTRNLCFDLMGKRCRGAVGVDDIEWVGDSGEMSQILQRSLPWFRVLGQLEGEGRRWVMGAR